MPKPFAAATMTPIPDGDGETLPGSGVPLPSGHSAARVGPLEPGAAFGARYRILRVLGSGGMGVVYQAWDDELGVDVALKVIRPEVVADPYVAREVEHRFKRELLLARQVTHKHVVRIHDLGEVDGIKYLTMPYVEGRNLAGILREGTIVLPRALRFARQIAAGLQASHEAGVVHRDLKPGNIMIDADDQALIMDFGISRSVSGTGAGTAAGAVIGTLEYMAPEQARGLIVDHRADIYAFGLMLYDLMGGRHRLEGADNAVAEMMSRMQRAPAPIQERAPHVPDALAHVIATCIEPDPDKRYQTTHALVAALEALDGEGRELAPDRPVRSGWRAAVAGSAILGVLFIGLAAGWWWSGAPPAPAATATRAPLSVLIADFVNSTNDPVFQGSLEQALGIAMEGAPFINAFPRGDAQRTLAGVAGVDRRLDEAGAKIVAASAGIPVVLAGAIAPRGSGGYTVGVRAIDPRSERTIASREVNPGSKAEVLEAIGSLATSMRAELGDTAAVASQAADAETFTAGSIEAMRAYARGQELNAAGRPREALKAFGEAVRVDSAFGRAYANMASIYTNLKMEDQAKEHYERALRHIDRMTPREKYRTRGVYYLGIARDYEQAIANFERLVNEYPADNMGYGNLALAYLYVRNIKNAVAVGRKATEVYPDNLLQRTNYATYSMYAGNFDTAIAQARLVLEKNASYEFAHLTLALSTLATGSVNDARAAYARLAATSPLGRSLATMGAADLEMYLGRHRRAIEILQAGSAADEKEHAWTNLAFKQVALAEAYLAIGQPKPAAAAAERALKSSRHEGVTYPAARVMVATGQAEKALALAAEMRKGLQTQTRSYGQLVSAAVGLHRKRYADAIAWIRESLKLHDSWAGHVLLAEAFSAAGQPALAEGEWDTVLTRRGEATDAFFSDSSTLRYLSPVYYWRGRAQELVGSAGARTTYEQFLQLRSDADHPDPLVEDSRRRLGR